MNKKVLEPIKIISKLISLREVRLKEYEHIFDSSSGIDIESSDVSEMILYQ